jgi:ABC-type antimicrobial peptide transport system permease subunit
VITAVLSAALLAALASFSATVTSYAVRTTLVRSPATTISLNASFSSAAAVARADVTVRQTLRQTLPTMPVVILNSVQSDYLDIPADLAGRNAETHVISLPDLAAHAVLLAGTWPGPTTPEHAEPVAVPSGLAAALHLSPGAIVTLREATTGAAEPVRITGVFRPRSPGDIYWSQDPVSGPQLTGGFTIYTSLVTSPAGLAGGLIPVNSASWLAEPDFSKVGAGGLGGAASQLQAGLNLLTTKSGLQDPVLSTGLPALLTGLQTALVVARSQLAIGILAFLVIAGATVALATTLLSQQREAEAALLRSRGASWRQMAGTGAAEALLLAAPAAAAGPVLGGLLLPWLARSGPLNGSGLRLPVMFPAEAWLAAGAAAAGCAVIIGQTWLRAESPVRARALSGRQRALAAATRSGTDLALIALAVLAGWQLARYSAPVSTGLDGSIGVDPVLVTAPVLALAAGALILLRALPAAVRLSDRAAARGRRLTAAVAAWQISRRPLRHAGPVLLAVLAVAMAVLATAQWTSWQDSARDQASFTTGADARVLLPTAAPLPLGQVASVARAPGVTAATPVVRSQFTAPAGITSTLLALDARQAMSVATIRPDLAGGSPAALLRRITPPAGPPGVPVPGRPARLAVTARLTAPNVTQAVLLVELRDAFGITYLQEAGLLAADGQAHQLTLTVAGPSGAAYPLRILGYQLQYLMPMAPVYASQAAAQQSQAHAGKQPLATLSIESVRGAAGLTAPSGAPLPAAPGPGPRTALASAGSGLVINPPAVSQVSVSGTRLSLSFQPGAALGPLQLATCSPVKVPCSHYSLVPATVTVIAGTSTVLPAVATRAFLAAAGVSAGGTVIVSVDGTSVLARIVQVVSAFPTISGPGGGLVVDQGALQQDLAVAGAQPQPVTEWWLQAAGSVPGLARVPGATTSYRAAVAQALLSSPLAAAPQVSTLVIASAALILAAAGFGVSAATARERTRDLALLVALGATRRQLTRLLCLEQAALAVPAAAAGLLLGAVLARLVVPAVTLTASGTHPSPPVLVEVPLVVSVAVALAIAVAPVLMAALGRGNRATAGLTARIRAEVQT